MIIVLLPSQIEETRRIELERINRRLMEEYDYNCGILEWALLFTPETKCPYGVSDFHFHYIFRLLYYADCDGEPIDWRTIEVCEKTV